MNTTPPESGPVPGPAVDAGPDPEPAGAAGPRRPPPPPPPPPPVRALDRLAATGPAEGVLRPPRPPRPGSDNVALIEGLLPAAPPASTIDLRPADTPAAGEGRTVIDLGAVPVVATPPGPPIGWSPVPSPPVLASADDVPLVQALVDNLGLIGAEDRRQIVEAVGALPPSGVARFAGSVPAGVATTADLPEAVVGMLLDTEPAQAAALAEVVLRTHRERLGAGDERTAAAAELLVRAHDRLDRQVLADLMARRLVVAQTVHGALGPDHPIARRAARALDRVRGDRARRRALDPRHD